MQVFLSLTVAMKSSVLLEMTLAMSDFRDKVTAAQRTQRDHALSTVP